MTIVSKIKTLIEYARFGMNMAELFKDNNSELFIPKSLPSVDFTLMVGNPYKAVGSKITAIRGHAKIIRGAAFRQGILEFVDLPKCIQIAWSQFEEAINLKEAHFAGMSNIEAGGMFYNCTALEVVEFGALTFMHNSTLKECTALHTFICGKGTAANLYLHDCPLLTQECLHNIIDNLADLTGTTSLTL